MEGAVMLKVVRMALEIISMRLLTILSMVMSFFLAIWTMSDPSWERMATSAFFAVCVYLPCISFERIKNENRKKDES